MDETSISVECFNLVKINEQLSKLRVPKMLIKINEYNYVFGLHDFGFENKQQLFLRVQHRLNTITNTKKKKKTL